MNQLVRSRARRLVTALVAATAIVGGVALPATAATSTVTYVPLQPTTAFTGDTVTFGEDCPQEVGAVCPSGGTGTVSIDGTKVGNLQAVGNPLAYRFQWTATGPDLGATAPTSHTYLVSFTDVTGTITINTTNTIVVYPRSPSAPQNLVQPNFSNGNHGSVTWSAPSQAGASTITGYEVSIDGGQATSVNTASYDVTYLTPGSHTIYVAATNSDGTGPSTSLTFFRPTTTLPSAPQNVLNSDGTNASVSWQAPASDGGSQVTQYAIQVDSGNYYYQSANQTTFNVSQVPGIAYGPHNIAVSAVNGDGQGPAVAVTSQYYVAPATPTNINILTPANKPVVTWTAPDDHGSPIIRYDIYIDNHRNPDSVTGSVLTYVIQNQSINNHTFHIAAYNAAGDSTYASVPFQVIAPTAPYPPQNLAVDTTNNHAVLNWTAPVTDGGAAIQNYIITVTGLAPVTVAATTTSYDLSGLSAGPYTVTVAAKNSVGTGSAATPIQFVRPPVSVPNPVTGVTATSGPAPSVSWTAPLVDGGQSVTGYLVSIDNATPIAVSGVTSTQYVFDTATLAYGAHTFTVQAVNAQGPSTASTPVTVTYESIPTAPSGLQLTTGVAQPVASWTASTVQGGSIQKYTVYVDDKSVGSTADGATLTFTLPVETPGVHTVAVTATSLFSTSTQSTAVQYTAPDVPGAPTNVVATVATGVSAHLTWTAPVANGGAPITGYTVIVDPGTGQQVYNVTGSSTVAFDVPAGVKAGPHTISVAAVNGVGTGPSASGSITLYAPVTLTLQAGVTPLVGGTVSLTGTAMSGTSPVANATVSLWSSTVGGTLAQLTTATTDATGKFTFTPVVAVGSVFQVQDAQDNTNYYASAASPTVTVIPALSASLHVFTVTGGKVGKVKVKTRLLFAATLPKAPIGTKVLFQIRVGSAAWKTFASVATTTGTVKAYYTFAKKGKYSFRVAVPGTLNVDTSVISAATPVTVS